MYTLISSCFYWVNFAAFTWLRNQRRLHWLRKLPHLAKTVALASAIIGCATSVEKPSEPPQPSRIDILDTFFRYLDLQYIYIYIYIYVMLIYVCILYLLLMYLSAAPFRQPSVWKFSIRSYFSKYLNIRYPYQGYRAYVLATDNPSCPKSTVDPQWGAVGPRLGPVWVPVRFRLAHRDKDILKNITWKIDTVPQSENS